MKYFIPTAVVAVALLIRAACGHEVTAASKRIQEAGGMKGSKVDITFRRIRYSEGSNRFIDFGYDYNAKEIVVYIPSPSRWEREKPIWAKARRTEIVGEVKRACDASLKPKPIYEEY